MFNRPLTAFLDPLVFHSVNGIGVLERPLIILGMECSFHTWLRRIEKTLITHDWKGTTISTSSRKEDVRSFAAAGGKFNQPVPHWNRASTYSVQYCMTLG